MDDSRGAILFCVGLAVCLLIGDVRTLGDNYSVHIKKSECKLYSDLAYNVTCTHMNLNWTTANDTLEMFLKPGVKLSNIFIKMTVFVRNDNMRYVPRYIINTTVDLCAALAGDTSNGLAVMFVQHLKSTSNFYHPCPLSVCTKISGKSFSWNW